MISKKKMMTIANIREEYLDMSYRKVKKFCLQFFTYKKIGNVYYFNRNEVEKKLLDTKDTHYKFTY